GRRARSADRIANDPAPFRTAPRSPSACRWPRRPDRSALLLPSRTCQTPSSTCTNCSNVPASTPRPTSTRRPPRSTTANALHVAAAGPVARLDTSTASNVLLPVGACRSRLLRYRASVLNPSPRSRQNSLRFNPLDSNSATNCSTSCRLRRRRTSHTCSSFMLLLHHSIHYSNRWFPLTLTVQCDKR